MNSFNVTSVQRLCVNDGPGVRTTVFFKGCTLHCPWCCNPETRYSSPSYYDNNRNEPVCVRMSEDEIFDLLIRDKDYYADTGGVTFSGGEPLLQAFKLAPLLERLKRHGVSICFETSLYVPLEFIKMVDSFVDCYIVDVKVIDRPFLFKENIDFVNSIDFEANLTYLCKKIYLLRMVLIDTVTDTKENIEKFKKLAETHPDLQVEFLQYHSLGLTKAKRLGVEQPLFSPTKEDRLAEILGQFKNARYEKV